MNILNFRRLTLLAFFLQVPQLNAEELEGRHVRLSLLKETSVNGNRVYLGDVADCKGDADLCREAGGIDVAGSPIPGRSIVLSQPQLTRILDKEWPGVLVTFEGFETARIVGAAAEVRSDDIKHKLQAWINDQLDYGGTIKLTVSKVVIPYGSGIRPSQSFVDFPDLEAVPFNQPEWLLRNMVGVRMTQFRFTNPLDGEDQQTAQGQAHIILEKMIPVASNLLSPGVVLEAKDLSMQWVQLRRGASEFISSQDQIIGKRLRQVLPAGEPFHIRSLDVANVVSRNQPVTMILKGQGLEVSTRATTMDAGTKGQIVDVINIANKKRMRAKVIDEQTVEAVAF